MRLARVNGRVLSFSIDILGLLSICETAISRLLTQGSHLRILGLGVVTGIPTAPFPPFKLALNRLHVAVGFEGVATARSFGLVLQILTTSKHSLQHLHIRILRLGPLQEQTLIECVEPMAAQLQSFRYTISHSRIPLQPCPLDSLLPRMINLRFLQPGDFARSFSTPFSFLPFQPRLSELLLTWSHKNAREDFDWTWDELVEALTSYTRRCRLKIEVTVAGALYDYDRAQRISSNAVAGRGLENVVIQLRYWEQPFTILSS